MVVAKRWLRQAELDLKAAQHLYDTGIGYEWACNICCEIIRKLLVACIAGKKLLMNHIPNLLSLNSNYQYYGLLHFHSYNAFNIGA